MAEFQVLSRRQERGLELAKSKTRRIAKRGPVWLVPSAPHSGWYMVERDGDGPGSSDTVNLVPLLESTVKRFSVQELSADMGYLRMATSKPSRGTASSP